MLFNLLILLLLSNSITSRRDKSILYSRVKITILLISTIIAYGNLSFLLLAKGIGIFAGLFCVSSTANGFHIWLFLTTSAILLLIYFYPKNVSLKKYISQNSLKKKSNSNGLLVFGIIGYIRYLFFIAEQCARRQGLKFKYIGDPMVLFSSSRTLLTSSFNPKKGKEKAEEKADNTTDKQVPDINTDSDDSNLYTKSEMDFEKARQVSLLPYKKGESSKTILSNDNSTGDYFNSVTNYVQDWKIYTDLFKYKARDYNDKKELLEKKGKEPEKGEIDPKENDKLNESKETIEEIKKRIARIENVLADQGVDPRDQYPPSEPSSESDYYTDDSYSSSDNRQFKKIKYQDTKNNFIWLSTFNFGLYPLLLRKVLYILFTIIYLFSIEFDIFPNIYLSIAHLNISFTQLVIIVFITNWIKLLFKWKNAIINLYNSYIHKDYLVIYTNLYLSVIIILFYLSDFNDVYILYL